MKARLVPLYFHSAADPDFVNQVQVLKSLLVDQAEILEPLVLGDALPSPGVSTKMSPVPRAVRTWLPWVLG